MSEFADMANDLLDMQGEAVSYQPQDGIAVEMTAIVSRFGRGPCPTGWPTDSFPGFARHAAFRLPAESGDGAATAEPAAGDQITVDGVAYTIADVVREPSTGPHGLWWICRCAAQARGRY